MALAAGLPPGGASPPPLGAAPPPPAANNAGNSELFGLDSRCEFRLRFLGSVSALQRSAQEMIEYIDRQRALGNVAARSTAADDARVVLTRYGLKVTDMDAVEVYQRIPLHTIASVVYYEEASGAKTLMVESGSSGTSSFNYLLFEAGDEHTATLFCETLQASFELLQRPL